MFSEMVLQEVKWEVSFQGRVSQDGVSLQDVYRVAITCQDGSVYHRDFPSDSDIPVDALVASTVKPDFFEPRLLQDLLTDSGMVPVNLNRQGLGLTGEGGVHYRLSCKKEAFSKPCLLANQALSMLAEYDRRGLGMAVQGATTSSFSGSRLPTRRDVALKMKDEVLACVAALGADPGGSRTADEMFALFVLRTACEMMTPRDWLWAWVGDLVSEVGDVCEATVCA